MKYLPIAVIFFFVFGHLVAQPAFTASHLPIMVINTGNLVIPNEPKITVTMGIIANPAGQTNQLSDPWNVYNGKIGIELRGSSSIFYEKSPYAIELRDDDGEDKEVSLLGMPEESDFALISPLNDKTLFRDALAYNMATDCMPWAPRTRYVELVLNNQYQGVYLLLETIKRDKDRVDIAKLEEEDIAGPELTGGYIIRVDKDDNGGVGGDWLSTYPPIQNGWQQTWFQYFYPKQDNIQPAQAQYIRNYIATIETAIANPAGPQNLDAIIDLDSWVNYALVQEVSKNTDGYRISAYMYKDRDDAPGGGRLTMGPVWDFNIAFGIGDYCGSQSWQGWGIDFNSVCPQDGFLIHFWWKKVWNHPEFRQKMLARWQELRSSAWSDQMVIAKTDSLIATIGDAQVRNFQRWPVMGTYVWPNAYIGSNYNQETSYLRQWLINRLHWMDMNIPALVSSSENPAFEKAPFVVYPNPSNGDFFIKTYSGIRQLGYVISVYNSLGQLVADQKIDAIGVFALNLSDKNLAEGIYQCIIRSPEGRLLYSEPMYMR